MNTFEIFLIIVFMIVTAIYIYAHKNMHYDEKSLKRTYSAGYKEKQVTLSDGTLLNYAEGPDYDGNPSLLLIHGQSMQWEDYSRVLPELAKYYHVYAIDCHGHGKSSHDSSKYTGISMGHDFVWFIKNVIGKPCVVSGHSSGGILAAWIAANSPENILGVVLEDPPFFSVEPKEMQNTFVWLENFKTVHNFVNQTKAKDYTTYYMENSYMWGLFGNLRTTLAKSTRKYRSNHPGKPLKLWYVPYKWIHGTLYLDNFDLKFSESFYTGSWFHGFSQEEILSNINCPSVYIKANTLYGRDGVLYAANSDQDGEKVHNLIKKNKMIKIKSGHDIHFEKPDKFIEVMISLVRQSNFDPN
ncbi:MAG: alpha/beta hydrolase [Clostridium sp.]|jgi:pimeloyl-ACP methyl ester carboxylesterase|uniref:alpha/beta hydrolase n=1 Tax=Clostridium sp. TaxID=1506 RepID=UPI0025BEFFBE|nr:alpha/beta hydrolase [Clostridium sp.]MCH3964885.1 alpha/beta hydrolase [Clostridium sp.]MCI1716620.1 alpha/beta hydrolase [Clostridium sp.]MCI1800898.1 alpha/beta hydrolase [Clostridium sp.]MCI1814797.1 alpha/beta hydrolase [Clostridium sp.]MCI1871645.1 alpha/beta hydrolase [Clostridium sp.]